jgi:hypothetical protein
MYILKWLFIQFFLIVATFITSSYCSSTDSSSDNALINNSSVINEINNSTNTIDDVNSTVSSTETIKTQNQIFTTLPIPAITDEVRTSKIIDIGITIPVTQTFSFKSDSNDSLTTTKLAEIDQNNHEKVINNTETINNNEFNSTSTVSITIVDTTQKILVDSNTPEKVNEATKTETIVIVSTSTSTSTSTITQSKKNQTVVVVEKTVVETSKLENFVIYIYIGATGLAASVIISIIVVSFIVRRRNKIKTLRRPSEGPSNRHKLPENSKPNYVKSRGSKNSSIANLQRDSSIEHFRQHNLTVGDSDNNYVATSSLDRNAFPLQTFATQKRGTNSFSKPHILLNNSEATTKKLSQNDFNLRKISQNRNAPKADLSEELSLLRPESSTSTSQNSFRKIGSKENSTTRIPLSHGSNFIINIANSSTRRISKTADDGEQIELEISRYPNEYSGKKRKSISLSDFNADPSTKVSSSLLIKNDLKSHNNINNNL